MWYGWKNFTFTRHKLLLVTVKEMVKIGAELPIEVIPKINLGIRFVDHAVHVEECVMLTLDRRVLSKFGIFSVGLPRIAEILLRNARCCCS